MDKFTIFVTMLTSFGWRLVEGYTYTTTYFRRYAMPLIETYGYPLYHRAMNHFYKREEEMTNYYPFTLVEEDGLKQVYYRQIHGAEFKFIQVFIDIVGEKHELNLNEFMVVGNRLFDSGFTEWIVDNQLDVDFTEDEEYTITIIDHDANVKTVSPNQYIVIHENSYDIETYDDEEEESTHDKSD